MEKNCAKLQEQIRTLLLQVDDVIAQDNAAKKEGIEFTAVLFDEISDELNKSLESVPEPKTKEELFMGVHNMEAYVKYNYFHKEQRMLSGRTL